MQHWKPEMMAWIRKTLEAEVSGFMVARPILLECLAVRGSLLVAAIVLYFVFGWRPFCG